jgi:hypothetical protein
MYIYTFISIYTVGWIDDKEKSSSVVGAMSSFEGHLKSLISQSFVFDSSQTDVLAPEVYIRTYIFM